MKKASFSLTLLCSLFFYQARIAATVYTMVPDIGMEWSDPNSWVPVGVPGYSDQVIINGGALFLDISPTVDSMTMIGGQIYWGTGNLTVVHGFRMTGGLIDNPGNYTVGGNFWLEGGTVHSEGSFQVNGNMLLSGSSTVFANYSFGAIVFGDFTWTGGSLSYWDSGSGISVYGQTKFAGTGDLHIHTRSLFLWGGGIWSGGNIRMGPDAEIWLPSGRTLTVSAPGGTFADALYGSPCNFIIDGTLLKTQAGALGFHTTFFNNTGTLGGKGSLEIGAGTTMSNLGHIAPGFPAQPRVLGIGHFEVPVPQLDIDIMPSSSGGVIVDQLGVTGNLFLPNYSTLNVVAAPNVPPGSYTILSWTGTRNGSFANVNLPAGCSIAYDDVLRKVTLVSLCNVGLSFALVKPKCPSQSNGKITANPTPAGTGYTYFWNTGATTKILQNVSAGTYTCTVTKTSTGCTAVKTAILSDPPYIDIALTISNVSCYGMADGSIKATPSGGTGAKTLLWSNGSTAATISNLPAWSTYQVTATDANGCTGTPYFWTIILAPPELVLTHSVQLLANGKYKITLSATGGTAYQTGLPYRYCKLSAANTCSFNSTIAYTNLLSGTSHTFRVRDYKNCQDEITVVLPSAMPAGVGSSPADLSIFENQSNSKIPENPDFKLSPNPARDAVQIIFSENAPITGTLEIRDLAGKTIRSTSLQSVAENGGRVSLENLPPGVFFLTVRTENGPPFSKKLVVD